MQTTRPVALLLLSSLLAFPALAADPPAGEAPAAEPGPAAQRECVYAQEVLDEDAVRAHRKAMASSVGQREKRQALKARYLEKARKAAAEKGSRPLCSDYKAKIMKERRAELEKAAPEKPSVEE